MSQFIDKKCVKGQTSHEAGVRTAVGRQPAPPKRDTFLENAASLFEVAEASVRADADGADWDILIGEEGAIRMVAASDWSLDSLQAHHGARMAYRVRRLSTRVQLEGRAGTRTCLFEAGTPDGAARLLLAPAVPWYTVAEPQRLLAEGG